MRLTIRAFVVLLASFSLQGCWFVFLPPSATSAISDAITGAEGANCVSNAQQVGDRIRLPDGSIGQIKSLSGTSTRCANPEKPIRALIVPISGAALPNASRPVPTINSALKINLPAGWSVTQVSDAAQKRGAIFRASNYEIEADLLLFSLTNQGVSDLTQFAIQQRGLMIAVRTDMKIGDIEAQEIDGNPARRFTVSGTEKNGRVTTSVVTIIRGEREIAILSVSAPASKFDDVSHLLNQMPDLIYGF